MPQAIDRGERRRETSSFERYLSPCRRCERSFNGLNIYDVLNALNVLNYLNGFHSYVRSSIADPWIQIRIYQINEKIYEDKNKRSEQNQTLDHRVVALADRFDEELADAVQVEHLLGHHQAADEERKLNSDYRNHRKQRVFERMTDQHCPLPEPLGAGRANIVFAQNFQDRRTRHARCNGGVPITDG